MLIHFVLKLIFPENKKNFRKFITRKLLVLEHSRFLRSAVLLAKLTKALVLIKIRPNHNFEINPKTKP